MKKKPYFPRPQSQQLTWFANFVTKITANAATFGITAAQVTLITEMVAFYTALINQIENLRADIQDWNKYKDDFCKLPRGSALATWPGVTISMPTLPTEAGLFATRIYLVKTIKAHANYTQAFGEAFLIIGDEDDFDPITFVPEISLKGNLPGEVIIDFKKDITDGVWFYCRTNGGAWHKRAFDTNPPYNDYTPLAVAGVAEKREYRCRAMLHEVEIGQYSLTLTVICGEEPS